MKVLDLMQNQQKDGPVTTDWCSCTLSEAVQLVLERNDREQLLAVVKEQN